MQAPGNITTFTDKKSSLRNPHGQKQYLRDGYLLLPGMAKQVVSALQDIFNQLNPPDQQVFGYSLMAHTHERNLEIHRLVTEALKPLTDEIFETYRLLSATFLIKPAGFADEMYLHQDWTFTHEDQFAPITLWIPLQDTHIQNGHIFVLPASHLFFENYRSYTLPTARISSKDGLKSYVKTLDMHEGDALLFHPALFHGSGPNNTDNNRVALSITVLPTEAPLIHVKKTAETSVQIHRLDDEAFLRDLRNLGDFQAFDGKTYTEKAYTHRIPEEVELIDLIVHHHD